MVVAFDGGVYSNQWYWQDGRGNTSHITGDNAYLLERYTYDLSGAPKFYDEWGNERFGGSVYDTRFLFAGSQYLPETGLYDMRNRFYSPTLNRFLQTDPIGFAGDALNLYRYCGDDPVDRSDPMGLADQTLADRTWNMACFFDGGNSFKGSWAEFNNRMNPAGIIVLELAPAGDRHHSVKEIRLKDGTRGVGLTVPDFNVREPTPQKDGSWKVTGVYTLEVQYPDGPGSAAGPKTLSHSYKEEWKHTIPFDRWYKEALETVKAMNRNSHFDSPAQAKQIMERQLREKFNEANAESLELHQGLKGLMHNSPYKYEE
jgi:RHS repeat-associated protein